MSQPRIYLSPPHMSGREQAYVADAIASNWVAPVGPHLAKFEQEFAKRIGVEHALAVTTGTAAIHLAQRCLELQPGDEVICSTFTFCASANPAIYEGAKPVFIDSDRNTWNMDPNLLEEELADCARRGRLPRAVVVVDILGQSADIDAINGITSNYDIPVIEDAAQALGSTYKGRPVGSSSWASTFSLNGNKIVTTSGGGLLCSNDEELIRQAHLLATQARDPVPYYQHSRIGFNYRMSNILAAIGLAQLEVLDQRVEARRRVFQFYRRRLGHLPGMSLMPQADSGRSNCWLTMIQIDPALFGATCDEVCRILEEQDIEARRVWKPLHLQPVFSGCRYRGGTVAEELFAKGLFLPSGSAMSQQDLERVAAGVQSARRCR